MSGNGFEISADNKEWLQIVESDDVGSSVIRVKSVPPVSFYPVLCRRLGLHSIEEVEADLTLQRNNVNKVIHVKGEIRANVHQKCVVTAEPVQESVTDVFDAWFKDPNQAVSFEKAKRERMSRKEQEKLPMIDEHDDPEEIIDGKINLSDLIVQYLSLALSPYPRVDGAVYQGDDSGLGDAPDGVYDNPFAALKDWKKGESNKDK
ncbi:MAG: YceD family protein [Alphaproteobacteria bacterium]